MIPDAIEVRLASAARSQLEVRLPAATTERRHVFRIRILLEAAEGTGMLEIAREHDITPGTVSVWCFLFVHDRLDYIDDLPRSDNPAKYGEESD